VPVLTATDFNQRPSAAKAMSDREPVFITDRGRITTVVLALAEYERLLGSQTSSSLGRALEADDDIDVEFVRDRSPGRVADFGD
jgi:hypothetical protein